MPVYCDMTGRGFASANLLKNDLRQRQGGGARFSAPICAFDDHPAKGAAIVDTGFDGHQKSAWGDTRIGDAISCASARFLAAKGCSGTPLSTETDSMWQDPSPKISSKACRIA